ncbi:unnamed protein product, partial [Amoebophrya sp. A120]
QAQLQEKEEFFQLQTKELRAELEKLETAVKEGGKKCKQLEEDKDILKIELSDKIQLLEQELTKEKIENVKAKGENERCKKELDSNKELVKLQIENLEILHSKQKNEAVNAVKDPLEKDISDLKHQLEKNKEVLAQTEQSETLLRDELSGFKSNFVKLEEEKRRLEEEKRAASKAKAATLLVKRVDQGTSPRWKSFQKDQ